jgi:hypothetical protein
MRAMQIRSLAALALLAVVPAACTAMSTYPPVDGKVVNTPSVSPGPEVMAGAIKEAHRLTAPNTDIVFNLPAGLPENTWNRVAFLLPDSARAMEPGDENVYSVKQLRIQGGSAEVDVIYPERGVYQLMTVKLEGGPVIPWRIQWAYRWVIPATAPVANDPVIAVESAEADRVAAEKRVAAERDAAAAATRTLESSSPPVRRKKPVRGSRRGIPDAEASAAPMPGHPAPGPW